jgi:anti-sigma B factor antagonist
MPTHETVIDPGSALEDGAGLEVSRGNDGATITLTLTGELDLHTVVLLRMRLAEAIAQGSSDVLVDLSDLTFIDSMGLATLLNGLRRLTRADRRMLIVSPGGPALRMLRLTRLDTTFDVHESVGAAMAPHTQQHPLAA